jgi:hypothetical protein
LWALGLVLEIGDEGVHDRNLAVEVRAERGGILYRHEKKGDRVFSRRERLRGCPEFS